MAGGEGVPGFQDAESEDWAAEEPLSGKGEGREEPQIHTDFRRVEFYSLWK
jgi:hypothetical protein